MDLHDHRAAVAPFVFAFQRNQRLLVGDALQQTGAGFLPILRRHEVPNGTANQLLFGKSKKFTLGLIHAQQHSVAIHLVAGYRRIVKPALKMALAIAEFLRQDLVIQQLQRFRRFQRRDAGADRASLHVQNATLL